MGDIGTHAEISRFVIDQVRKVVPDTTIPAADYAFLKLGNFLTAVRQPDFRQPDVGRLRDQPQPTLLGPRRDANRLAARRAASTTAQLEAYYRSLES